jgi:outer membrane protein assembly factor BamB
MTRYFAMLAWTFSVSLCALTFAGDWPQILGPNRNGTANGEKLLEKWPAAGPKIAWRAAVGTGYAGPAIAEGRVIVFHRVDQVERIEAFDLQSGRSLWQADFPATYRTGIDADKGPRCVPVIHKDQVFVFGAGGDLHCVSLATGQKQWSRDLWTDYKTPEGYFGAGSSPIVAGERLWLNLGGEDAGLIALDLKSGKTLFAGTEEQASYSSPTTTTIDGRELVVFVTRYNCVGIDALTGEPVFTFPFGMRGPTVNAATPVVVDDKVFVTASYGVGARLAKMNMKPKSETIWENDDSMSSQYNTPVFHEGYFYGIDGREDVGIANLRCVDAATGKVAWSADEFGMAHLVLANDQLILVGNSGQVTLAAATPKKFTVLSQAQLVDGTIRALPALSQGKLVVRTVAQRGRGEIICAVVGQ